LKSIAAWKSKWLIATKLLVIPQNGQSNPEICFHGHNSRLSTPPCGRIIEVARTPPVKANSIAVRGISDNLTLIGLVRSLSIGRDGRANV